MGWFFAASHHPAADVERHGKRRRDRTAHFRELRQHVGAGGVLSLCLDCIPMAVGWHRSGTPYRASARLRKTRSASAADATRRVDRDATGNPESRCRLVGASSSIVGCTARTPAAISLDVDSGRVATAARPSAGASAALRGDGVAEACAESPPRSSRYDGSVVVVNSHPSGMWHGCAFISRWNVLLCSHVACHEPTPPSSVPLSRACSRVRSW